MKSINIFNNTKNKKLILIAFILIFVFGFLAAGSIVAQEPGTSDPGIKLIPNISIPGSDFSKGRSVTIGPDSIGQYIVALYEYGAGLAGVVAMFMLVFAGWQWLMAAGRADQITKAKETIVNVFVGLALLFGGYLLMSQISQNSVNFKDIQLAPIEPKVGHYTACERISELVAELPSIVTPQCGEPIGMSPGVEDTELNFLLRQVGDEVQCISKNCTAENHQCIRSRGYTSCPSASSLFEDLPECYCAAFDCDSIWENGNDCSAYKFNSFLCNANGCYDEIKLPEACRFTTNMVGSCVGLDGKTCEKNYECFFDSDDNDESEYCCVDINNHYDECFPIELAETGPAGSDPDDYRGCGND